MQKAEMYHSICQPGQKRNPELLIGQHRPEESALYLRGIHRDALSDSPEKLPFFMIRPRNGEDFIQIAFLYAGRFPEALLLIPFLILGKVKAGFEPPCGFRQKWRSPVEPHAQLPPGFVGDKTDRRVAVSAGGVLVPLL